MDYGLLSSDVAVREHANRLSLSEENRNLHVFLEQIRAERRLHRAVEAFLRVDGDPRHVLDLVPGPTPRARHEAFASPPTGGCCASTH